MEIIPKYNLDELVAYNGNIYRITHIYAINWFMQIPFVYGLLPIDNNYKQAQEYKELLVREGLLKKINKK